MKWKAALKLRLHGSIQKFKFLVTSRFLICGVNFTAAKVGAKFFIPNQFVVTSLKFYFFKSSHVNTA